MKTLARLTLTAALACTVGTIWSPWHWQMAATAVVLLIVGAAILGSHKQQLDAAMTRHPAGKHEGPTVITNDTGQPERIARPTYGRKADR